MVDFEETLQRLAETVEGAEGNWFDRRSLLKGGVGLLAGGALMSCCGNTVSPSSPLPIDEIAAEPATAAKQGEGDSYCVYQITKITAGADACPFKLLDTVCVDCPPEGNCLNHASVGARRWVLWTDAEKTRQICSGEWVINNKIVVVNGKVVQADCAACPDGGKKGYRFI
jgi:hypothetical protein